MSKVDIHEVQEEVETYGWQRGLHLICRLQCTKEPTVIARTVKILEKCSCTTEDTTVLKGGKTTVYHVVHVYSTVHSVHVYCMSSLCECLCGRTIAWGSIHTVCIHIMLLLVQNMYITVGHLIKFSN